MASEDLVPLEVRTAVLVEEDREIQLSERVLVSRTLREAFLNNEVPSGAAFWSRYFAEVRDRERAQAAARPPEAGSGSGGVAGPSPDAR